MYMKPRSVLSTSATPGFCTLITTSSPVFKVAAYTYDTVGRREEAISSG